MKLAILAMVTIEINVLLADTQIIYYQILMEIHALNNAQLTM